MIEKFKEYDFDNPLNEASIFDKINEIIDHLNAQEPRPDGTQEVEEKE